MMTQVATFPALRLQTAGLDTGISMGGPGLTAWSGYAGHVVHPLWLV